MKKNQVSDKKVSEVHFEYEEIHITKEVLELISLPPIKKQEANWVTDPFATPGSLKLGSFSVSNENQSQSRVIPDGNAEQRTRFMKISQPEYKEEDEIDLGKVEGVKTNQQNRFTRWTDDKQCSKKSEKEKYLTGKEPESLYIRF